MSDKKDGQNKKEETVGKEKPVRVILLGILGPPERWQAAYSVVERVCRPMCFPFSPDQPETDRRLVGNVIEYASTATDLQGDVIAGQPTIVFCMPGVDRTRRMGLLVEAIPRALLHHRVYGGVLYFGRDVDEEMSMALMEATARGVQTWGLGAGLDDFDEQAFAEELSSWMTKLDPQAPASGEAASKEPPSKAPDAMASPIDVF